ncbi:MAG: DUF4321 domain-containing protein [Clostridia bacterium]|nr:DUF4321 domain-containing protein [Clostridia bacterium]
MRAGRRTPWGYMLLFFIVGVFAGNAIGRALAGTLPAVAKASSLGFAPTSLNLLDFIRITLGFHVSINVLGALGGLLAVILARRYL